MSIFPTLPPQVAPILQSIWSVWAAVWWIVVPVIGLIIAWEAWLLYLHYKWHHGMHFVLLEIKVPKNILKSPKSMEQIFAAAHAPFSYGYKWYQKYIQGMDEYWMSFELIGKAGETHFYLRVPGELRNMMEAAIYGQYPEAEISLVEDYLDSFPKVLPNENFDISGFEEVLRDPKMNFLPIRTYPSFEDPVEERRVDPIGGLMEIMSKLKEGEQLWMQMIVEPTGDEVMKEGLEHINKLYGIEEKHEKKASLWPSLDLGITLSGALRAPFQHPGTEAENPHESAKEAKQQRFLLSPHDKEVAEAIQQKIAKLSFEATVRFIVLTPKNSTHGESGHIMSIHGFVRQFNSQINQLKPDKATTTAGYAVKGLFKKPRLQYRKRLLYEHYRNIQLGAKSVLNVEELATLFHFPLGVVSTTELEKVESRKGSPPAGLPIIEE